MKKTNFSTFQATDYTITLTCATSAGTLIDLTGYTVYMTIKSNPSDTDANAVIKKKVTGFTSTPLGIATILLTATNTATLLGSYYYDITYEAIDTTIHRGMSGIITFDQPITLTIS